MKSEVRSLMAEKRGRRIFLTAAMLAILSVVAIGTLQAKGPPPPLTLSISDPAGDPTGSVDVTGMDMTFTPNNGKFTIVLTAAAAHPFFGQFRVNINLFNATGDTEFSDTLNDFNLSTATTTLTLTGTDKTLKSWNPGDRVATSTYAGLGNPPGVPLFRSSVANPPFTSSFTSEDVIGYNDQTGDASSGVAVIQ